MNLDAEKLEHLQSELRKTLDIGSGEK